MISVHLGVHRSSKMPVAAMLRAAACAHGIDRDTRAEVLRRGPLGPLAPGREGRRQAGGRALQGLKPAGKFKADVEFNDHDYPPNFAPKHGYVTESEMKVLQDLATRAADEPALSSTAWPGTSTC